MYSCPSPGDRVSIVEMNSELEHAQLELLSAHCATHQLRLRYSSDDLARLGRPDLLRKSAEAASALNEFYSAIEKNLPQPSPLPSLPSNRPRSDRACLWVALDLLARAARPLCFRPPHRLAASTRPACGPISPSNFSARYASSNSRAPVSLTPNFFGQARACGYDPPEISHMDSLTFLDVVVFNEPISERALFHALVHTVQIQVLGLERYAELWVRSFVQVQSPLQRAPGSPRLFVLLEVPPPLPGKILSGGSGPPLGRRFPLLTARNRLVTFARRCRPEPWPAASPSPSGTKTSLLTVVIAIIPVVFFAPPVLVLVPPAVMFAPAALSRLVQFVPLVFRLPAVSSVALDGLMQFMISVRNPALAGFHCFRMRPRRSRKQKCSAHHCQRQQPSCHRTNNTLFLTHCKFLHRLAESGLPSAARALASPIIEAIGRRLLPSIPLIWYFSPISFFPVPHFPLVGLARKRLP